MMPVISLRRLAAVLWMGGLLAACQTPGPVAPHLQQETLALDTLLGSLKQRQQGVADLKSMVRTTVENPKVRQSFKQALVLKNDEAFRIDTYNVFGQTLGVFIYNENQPQGVRTVMYDPAKNRVFVGGEVRHVLQETLGLSLDFREFLPVFYGGIPRLERLRVTHARLSPDKSIYQLIARDPVEGNEVWIDVDAYTLLPVQLMRVETGQKIYTVQWDDYRSVGEHRFPHQITIHLKQRGEILTVKYTDPQINSGVASDTFLLSAHEIVVPATGF